MKDLREKKVVITGAATGIGQATALALADEGCELFIVTSKNASGLAETQKKIEAQGRRCHTMMVDVSRREQVEAMIQAAIKAMGHIDILMNNAGVGTIGEVKDFELSDWECILGINFWGVVYGVHYVLPHMIARRSGHIINVASAAGLFTMPGFAAYSASKFSVVGMSEALHGELSRHRIGITCVCPAFVRTNILETTGIKGWKDIDRSLFAKYALGPEVVAQEIIKAVKKNKYLLVLTPEGKLFYHLKRLWPSLYFGMGPIQGWLLNRNQEQA